MAVNAALITAVQLGVIPLRLPNVEQFNTTADIPAKTVQLLVCRAHMKPKLCKTTLPSCPYIRASCGPDHSTRPRGRCTLCLDDKD